MRIIQAAKKTDEFVTSCYRCGSVLGVREVDLKWINMDWAFGCPVCGATNDIDGNKDDLFPWKLEESKDAKAVPGGDTVREY